MRSSNINLSLLLSRSTRVGACFALLLASFLPVSTASAGDKAASTSAVTTQALHLLRVDDSSDSHVGHGHTFNDQSTTRDLSPLTIFEYDKEQSLVLADHEWEHIDKLTLDKREQFVFSFFERKLLKASAIDTKAFLYAELEMLSAYFAKHEQAFRVIQTLNKSPLKLKYEPHTFRTEVRADRIRIIGATVLFDPKAYALVEAHQFGAKESAAMSAADALLHELLHAQAALKQSKAFIASGAMQTVGYPVEHERKIIAQERALFKSMTLQDGVQRPSRHKHAGRISVSNCSLCLQ